MGTQKNRLNETGFFEHPKHNVVGTQKNRLNETGFFEHPKHILKLMGKKIFTILG